MASDSNLSERLRVPYSIGTGVPAGGDAEIAGYLQSLRVQGFCVVERVIPEDQVGAVRASVHQGRELLLQEPHAELCDIARNETFAEYLAEPRVLRVARAMLDTHVRILQTEVNKSSKPEEQSPSHSRTSAWRYPRSGTSARRT